MAGKRRSVEESLIEAVAYADSPRDRLQAAEDVLTRQIEEIRGDRDAINLVELGISSEEIKWIDLQVGHALMRTAGDPGELQQITSTYPRMVVASLAGAAMRADSDAAFWADWARRLGLSADGAATDGIQSEVSRAIVDMLRAAGLKTYDTENDAGGHGGDDSVVNLIRLHVGFTASGVQTVVEAYLDEDISATRLGLALQKDDQAPWTLREFLRREPDLAAFFLKSTAEFIDYTLDTPDWYATERKDAFEGQADLPASVFGELVNVLANRDEYGREGTPMERVFIRPRLWLDEELGTVHLRLTVPTGEETADWVLSAPTGVRRVRHHVDDSTVDQSAQDVPLLRPVPKFTVSLPAHGREWDMDLFPADKPVIFFNAETGRRIGRIRRLRATEVLALAPAQTTFTGEEGTTVHDPAQALPLRAWAGWHLYRLDLSATTSVDIRFDQIDTRLNVQLDRRSKLRFGTSNPIHGMVGPDGRPVFATSPTITIPESETGEWSRRIFYLYGEERQDVFGVPLLCGIGETTDIFSESPDVWIGRFDIHVFHNGLFVASRIYNVAEDIAVTFDYDSAELLGFRYPDSRPTAGGLTPASYQLSYTGGKDIELSDEWGELGVDELSSLEHLQSQEGYTLDAVIVPERLTFRIDRRDRAGSWRSFPEAVDTMVLDPDGDLTVRLPQPATGAQLTLFDLGRPQEGGRTVDLQAVSRATYRTAIASLAHFYHGAETVLMSLTWHPEVTDDSVLAGVEKPTARTRARIRAAAKKGTSANLGLLTRQPLLTSARTDGTTITVEPHQATSRLVVWAWPLHQLSAGPEELALDEETFTAPVPESLRAVGPLVVDAADTGFVLDPVAPATPSDRAIVVTREQAEEPGAEEIPELKTRATWEAENLLAALTGPTTSGPALTDLSRLTGARREALLSQPRLALAELGVSPLSGGDRAAAFISSGLVAGNFIPRDEQMDAVDSRGEFWGGLLLAAGDLVGLAQSGTTDATDATSAVGHLRRLGGEGLVATLRSGWAVGDTFASINKAERAFLGMYEGALLNGVPPVPQPWASENRRRQALTELYRRRHLIAHLEVVPRLVEQVIRLENQVLKNVASEVVSMQATQRSDAQDQGDPVSEPWAWVPYISTTLAFMARLRAYGVIGKIRGREAIFAAWSRLAGLVPQLTVTDIVLADATVSSLQQGLAALTGQAGPAEPEVATSVEELAAAVVPVTEKKPAQKSAQKPTARVVSVAEQPAPAAKPAPARQVPAKPAAPARSADVDKPADVSPHNRAILDIHRVVVETLGSFVSVPLAEDATPEELMLRSKFVGDLFGQLRAYRLDVDKDMQADLSALLQKAEARTKTTGATAELESFLREEERCLQE